MMSLVASVDARLAALASAHGLPPPPDMAPPQRDAFCAALTASVTGPVDLSGWWGRRVEEVARERAAAAWAAAAAERAAEAAALAESQAAAAAARAAADREAAARAAAARAAPQAGDAAPPPPPPAADPEATDEWRSVRVAHDGAGVAPSGSLYSLSRLRAAAAAAAGPSPARRRPGAPLVPWMSVHRPADGLWLPLGPEPVREADLGGVAARGERDAARTAARAARTPSPEPKPERALKEGVQPCALAEAGLDAWLAQNRGAGAGALAPPPPPSSACTLDEPALDAWLARSRGAPPGPLLPPRPAAPPAPKPPPRPPLVWGPPAPPHVAAALRAALVDAVLGPKAHRAFAARVVGRAVERAGDGG